MEANVTISVEVDTLPRLISHLIAEEELRLEPLARRVARASHDMEQGRVFEATRVLEESLETLSSIEARLKQCNTLIKGMGNALNGQPDTQKSSTQDMIKQVQDMSKFSNFLSKMEDDEENED